MKDVRGSCERNKTTFKTIAYVYIDAIKLWVHHVAWEFEFNFKRALKFIKFNSVLQCQNLKSAGIPGFNEVYKCHLHIYFSYCSIKAFNFNHLRKSNIPDDKSSILRKYRDTYRENLYNSLSAW